VDFMQVTVMQIREKRCDALQVIGSPEDIHGIYNFSKKYLRFF
jgi:hypothetical protein